MNYKNILQTIGNTPVVEIKKLNPNPKVTLLAKLEFINPGGSVKDRIGLAMIEKAEQAGKLKKGGTIIEPTSGNTGVGLAMVAALRGYRMIFVMPDKMSQEKRSLLQAYGAQVIITPTKVSPDDPRSYYQVAQKLTDKIKGAYKPDQYSNPANPQAHYQTTGPEIWRQTQGQVTHVVIGAGTGGTISGVGKFLKQKNPRIKVIAADPRGSIYAHYFKTRKIKKVLTSYQVEGVGEDFLPQTIDFKYIDQVITVSDRQAFLTTRKLARQEGILAGGSSGMAFYAAQKCIKQLTTKAVLVVIFPDSGRSYLSKIFNDQWMINNRFLKNNNK
jgi:cystathionine beta-synthase